MVARRVESLQKRVAALWLQSNRTAHPSPQPALKLAGILRPWQDHRRRRELPPGRRRLNQAYLDKRHHRPPPPRPNRHASATTLGQRCRPRHVWPGRTQPFSRIRATRRLLSNRHPFCAMADQSNIMLLSGTLRRLSRVELARRTAAPARPTLIPGQLPSIRRARRCGRPHFLGPRCQARRGSSPTARCANRRRATVHQLKWRPPVRVPSPRRRPTPRRRHHA